MNKYILECTNTWILNSKYHIQLAYFSNLHADGHFGSCRSWFFMKSSVWYKLFIPLPFKLVKKLDLPMPICSPNLIALAKVLLELSTLFYFLFYFFQHNLYPSWWISCIFQAISNFKKQILIHSALISWSYDDLNNVWSNSQNGALGKCSPGWSSKTPFAITRTLFTRFQ